MGILKTLSHMSFHLKLKVVLRYTWNSLGLVCFSPKEYMENL